MGDLGVIYQVVRVYRKSLETAIYFIGPIKDQAEIKSRNWSIGGVGNAMVPTESGLGQEEVGSQRKLMEAGTPEIAALHIPGDSWNIQEPAQ